MPGSTSKKLHTISLYCFLLCITVSQCLALFSQTNISGVVNTYHSVIEIIPAKACLRVTNVGAINLNTRVLIVQMKGATVNISNNSSFGTVTAYNDAGNYEIGTVCYIIGDSVFLFHELLNTYDPSNGKVQMVQFAEYNSANIIDTLKATPWNNTNGTGGVIALFADQDITLNAPIYADSSGYSGGSGMQSGGSCNNAYSSYFYNPTAGTQGGAYKGESIATLTIAQSGGRGSPASGGGGGNNHNNSGGGGGNLNTGGDGGGNSSSTGCSATYKGIGGKALSSNSGQKIFLGGGGGAGHYNYSGSNSYGGNGGGIIFIWANNINGNNQTISANGVKGGNSISDGAGGGGAGGTIILHSTNYTGNLTINAKGGNGGNSNDNGNLNYCYGGGGGGSGGVIYFTGSTPAITTSVTKGAAGLETGRDASCGTIQPASDGSDGQIISNYIFSRSTTPAGYCSYLLPVKLISFSATLQNNSVTLKWEVENPSEVKHFIAETSVDNIHWTILQITTPGNEKNEYTLGYISPQKGKNFYRLRITGHDNLETYSPVRLINTGEKEVFTVFPNPVKDYVHIWLNTQKTRIVIITGTDRRKRIQEIIRPGLNNISLDKLEPGVYFIIIDNTVRKLLVTR